MKLTEKQIAWMRKCSKRSQSFGSLDASELAPLMMSGMIRRHHSGAKWMITADGLAALEGAS